ncbi:MAG: beta strand repeat-containing protein [Spirosomataceae bacterium]
MKKFIQTSILTSLFLCFSVSVFAQQAAEIDSKFIKIPRYANLTAITSAIASPTQGTIVYNIATASNWYYNGSAWTNMASGLTLPYSQSQTLNSGDLFSITNTSATVSTTASSIKGEFNGVVSNLTGKGIGVYGRGIRTSGTGVAFGVYGETVSDVGVAGVTNTFFATGTGVLGYSDAGYGVNGNANSGIGGYFSSTSGYALVTSSGNVGIGTTTPTAKLDILGSVKIANGSQGANKVLVSDVNGLTTWQTISSSSITAPLSFSVANSSPIFSATNTGNGRAGYFSINNPSSSANALYVESNSSGFGALNVRSTGGRAAVIDAPNSIALTATTSSNSEVAQFVNEGVGRGLWIYTTNVSNSSNMLISEANGGVGIVGSSVTGIGGSFSSASGYALITGSGNVGIGTNTPTAKLEVAGQTKVNNSANTSIDASNSSGSNPTVKITNSTNLGPAIDLTGGIRVSGTNKTAFKIVTSATFIIGNKFGIVNTTMANASTDILLVTYEYTGGTYLNKQFATFWNGSNWEIHLTDGSAMPTGITFNVLVIKQ